MAKGQEPADQMEEFSKDAMAQAYQLIDTYFDFLKKSVSSFPTGGTKIGKKLKDQSVQNVAAVHDLVKRLVKQRILNKHFEFRPNSFKRNFKHLGNK